MDHNSLLETLLLALLAGRMGKLPAAGVRSLRRRLRSLRREMRQLKVRLRRKDAESAEPYDPADERKEQVVSRRSKKRRSGEEG
jgi:Sec-independent protein translocase protein TatA